MDAHLHINWALQCDSHLSSQQLGEKAKELQVQGQHYRLCSEVGGRMGFRDPVQKKKGGRRKKNEGRAKEELQKENSL